MENHQHTPESISDRLSRRPKASYLRDFVYGGIDGSITTFAIVAGVWGAQLSTKTMIILGISNLLADGFSMAASNYLGSKAERDDIERLRALEQSHISRFPAGEREEVRQIFARKGVEGPALEEVVTAICSNRERWVSTMLSEEYGKSPVLYVPLKAAGATFLAFVICGAIPLVVFTASTSNPFYYSSAATGLVFFVIGSIKSRWSTTPWWKSGMTTLAVGASASALAFLVGSILA